MKLPKKTLAEMLINCNSFMDKHLPIVVDNPELLDISSENYGNDDIGLSSDEINNLLINNKGMKAQKWHKYPDEPPKEDMAYLVYGKAHPGSFYAIMWFANNKFYDIPSNPKYEDSITHWMKLPEVPK